MRNRKTIIIAAAAVLLAGLGFGAGMMAKSALADRGNDIGLDTAKEIALASVGVSAEKATFTKSVLDAEDNAYEIDFYTETNEYDFEIAADTGAITDREVSPRDLSVLQGSDSQKEESAADSSADSGSAADSSKKADSSAESAAKTNDDAVIGVTAAKNIALKHAGLSSAVFYEASLDYDDGIRVYDLEFTAEGTSYDYEINALSGKIIEYDIESDDDDDDDDDD